MIGFLYQDNKSSLFHYEQNVNGTWTGSTDLGPGCERHRAAAMGRVVGLRGGLPGAVRRCGAGSLRWWGALAVSRFPRCNPG